MLLLSKLTSWLISIFYLLDLQEVVPRWSGHTEGENQGAKEVCEGTERQSGSGSTR